MSSPTDKSDLDEFLDNYKPLTINKIFDKSSKSSMIDKKFSYTTETQDSSNILDKTILENISEKKIEISGESQTETNVLNRTMIEDTESNQILSNCEKENISRYDNPFFVSKRLSGVKNTFETPARKNTILSEVVNVQNTPMFQKTPMEKNVISFTKQTNHSATFPELKLNLFAPPKSPTYSDQEDDTPFENPFCLPKRLSFSNHTYSGKKNLFSTFENFKTPIRIKKVDPESQNIQNTPLPQNKIHNFETPNNFFMNKHGAQHHFHSVTFPEITKTNIEDLPNQFKTPIQPDVGQKNDRENRHLQKEKLQVEEFRPPFCQDRQSQNNSTVNEINQTKSPEGLDSIQNKHIEYQNYSNVPKNKKYSIGGLSNQNGANYYEMVNKNMEEKVIFGCEVSSKKNIQIQNQCLSPIIEDCVREKVIRNKSIIASDNKKVVKILDFLEESPVLESNYIKSEEKIVESISPQWDQNYNTQPVLCNKNVKRLFENEQAGGDNNMAVQDGAQNTDFQPHDKLGAVVAERRMSQPPQPKHIPNPPKDNFVKPTNKNSSSVVKDFKHLMVKKKAYIIISKLGEGGTCQVFDCLEPDTLQHRAIKIVNLSVDAVTASGCVNEVKMLKALQGNEYVIKIFDYEISNNTLFVVMEKGGIDLSVFLRNIAANKSSFLPIHVINYYWMEMLNCVKEIHDAGIIHSDLKPSNFLIVDGRLKLIDFGIASRLSSDMTSVIKNVQVGTFNYISPEALLDSRGGNSPVADNKPRIKISYKSDVWSLGCILYQLVYSKTPFHNVGNTFAKISMIMDPSHKIEYPNLRHVPLRMIDTVRKCLQYNMKMRPTVNELIAMNNPD